MNDSYYVMRLNWFFEQCIDDADPFKIKAMPRHRFRLTQDRQKAMCFESFDDALEVSKKLPDGRVALVVYKKNSQSIQEELKTVTRGKAPRAEKIDVNSQEFKYVQAFLKEYLAEENTTLYDTALKFRTAYINLRAIMYAEVVTVNFVRKIRNILEEWKYGESGREK